MKMTFVRKQNQTKMIYLNISLVIVQKDLPIISLVATLYIVQNSFTQTKTTTQDCLLS